MPLPSRETLRVLQPFDETIVLIKRPPGIIALRSENGMVVKGVHHGGARRRYGGLLLRLHPLLQPVNLRPQLMLDRSLQLFEALLHDRKHFLPLLLLLRCEKLLDGHRGSWLGCRRPHVGQKSLQLVQAHGHGLQVLLQAAGPADLAFVAPLPRLVIRRQFAGLWLWRGGLRLACSGLRLWSWLRRRRGWRCFLRLLWLLGRLFWRRHGRRS